MSGKIVKGTASSVPRALTPNNPARARLGSRRIQLLEDFFKGKYFYRYRDPVTWQDGQSYDGAFLTQQLTTNTQEIPHLLSGLSEDVTVGTTTTDVEYLDDLELPVVSGDSWLVTWLLLAKETTTNYFNPVVTVPTGTSYVAGRVIGFDNGSAYSIQSYEKNVAFPTDTYEPNDQPLRADGTELPITIELVIVDIAATGFVKFGLTCDADVLVRMGTSVHGMRTYP